MLVFATLVVASGISCFFLPDAYTKLELSARIPLFGLLGISFAFSLSFSFSEVLAFAPCDRCCNSNLTSNPVFGSPKQVFAFFFVSLVLGITFGVLFVKFISQVFTWEITIRQKKGMRIGLEFGQDDTEF